MSLLALSAAYKDLDAQASRAQLRGHLRLITDLVYIQLAGFRILYLRV